MFFDWFFLFRYVDWSLIFMFLVKKLQSLKIFNSLWFTISTHEENYNKKLFYDFYTFYLEIDMGDYEIRGMFFFTLTLVSVYTCYHNFSENLLVLLKSMCSFLPHIFYLVWGKKEQFFLPQYVFILIYFLQYFQ